VVGESAVEDVNARVVCVVFAAVGDVERVAVDAWRRCDVGRSRH
jgi:hypothetical protein